MDQRPKLDTTITINDFKDFYWLKEELIAFCRKEGLDRQGGKIDLANRIEEYLKTGRKLQSKNTNTSASKFNWNKEPLSLHTQITDNYKNTENVRAFFAKQIGSRFKFNVKFMSWMKANIGKTLEDAINEWLKIEEEKKETTAPKEIAPQFEYNRYIRDFLKDNPDSSRETAIKHWKIKRSMRGDNIYKKTDLTLETIQ